MSSSGQTTTTMKSSQNNKNSTLLSKLNNNNPNTTTITEEKSSKNTKDNNKNNNTTNEKQTESKEEKYKKFQGDGVQFKAKLIGSELVIEPRGDKICQDSIQRLKAIIRGQKAHKRRILIKISYQGVKIVDEKSNEVLYHNEVPQISFIASDDLDQRTFGYICDVPNKAHRFICLKTMGPAVQVMSVISCLFDAVLEQKSNAPLEKQGVDDQGEGKKADQENDNKTQSNKELQSLTGNLTSSIVDQTDEGEYLEFGDAIVEGATATGGKRADDTSNRATKSSPAAGAAKGSILDLVDEQLGDLFISSSAVLDRNLSVDFDWDQTNQLGNNKLVKQSTLKTDHQQQGPTCQASDSLIGGTSFATAANSITGDSGILDSPSSPFGKETGTDWKQASSVLANNQQQTASRPIQLPRPPPSRVSSHVFSSSVKPNTNLMVSPNDDPLSVSQNKTDTHHNNRSLIYNHSSVSLNEAALTRQSSFGGLQNQNQLSHHNDRLSQSNSGTDKYAVFNDIDNLPSIFESTSTLDRGDSMNKLGSMSSDPFTQSLSASHHYHQQPFFANQMYHHQQHQQQKPRQQQQQHQQQQRQQQQPVNSLFSSPPEGNFFFGSTATSAGHLAPSNHQAFTNKQSSGPNLFYANNSSDSSINATQAAFINTTSPSGFQTSPNIPIEYTCSPAIPTNSQPMPTAAFGPSAQTHHYMSSMSNIGLDSMIVGSAPMGGLYTSGAPNSHNITQMAQDHARFSSSMMAGGIHQRLGSSVTNMKKAGSTSGLSRQTNPFDDDFFA